ncbi:MAG: GNAT family N-acetyltransferase [Verrucomicrobiota bacterium]
MTLTNRSDPPGKRQKKGRAAHHPPPALAPFSKGVAEIELAYLLSPRFWGRGLASEAARAIRDLAFSTLGCSRLVSLIHPANLASKRVAHSVGMTFSQTTRHADLEVEVFSITQPPNHALPPTSVSHSCCNPGFPRQDR